MAYTTNTFSVFNATVEGLHKQWIYITADSLATVKGAAYFSDAPAKGVTAGDIVYVINTTTPAFGIYAFTTAGAAAGTVASTAIVF